LVPKLKKSALPRDGVGGQRGARQLDHRADQIFDVVAGLGEDLLRDAVDQRAQDLKLALRRPPAGS
jgi:hypothetical protein